MMPGAHPGNDDERLPWLEPYRDPGSKARAKPAAPVAPAKTNKRGAGLLAGGIAAIVAALTAGYWIGQRGTVAPSSAPVAVARPAPPPVAAPVIAPAPPEAAPMIAQAPPEAAPQPAPEARATPKARVIVHRWAPRQMRQRKIRNAGIESARFRQVEAAQQRAAAARQAAARQLQAGRAWPRMPSPGPAGQVIQLGAFRTPARAYAAYRLRLARYPTLAALPRAILPVITKPRGQILYVLRLGTTSRQQSGIVCRNLRASGDHCLVIG